VSGRGGVTPIRERFDEAFRVIGRLIAIAAVTGVTMFLLGIVLKPVLPDGLPSGREGRAFFALIASLALVVGHVVAALGMEKRNWAMCGMGAAMWRPADLLTAPFVGAMVVMGPALALLWLGKASLEPTMVADWTAHAGRVLADVATGLAPEALILRGYMFGLLQDRWGKALPLAVGAIASMAIVYLTGGGGPWVAAAAAAMGLLLGAVRVASGSVMASWLTHVAAMWCLGAVLNAPSPWAPVNVPLHRWSAGGPEWLTGGGAGPETGLLAAATLVVVSFIVLHPRRPSHARAR